MDSRQVMVYVRTAGHPKSSHRTVAVALDGVDVDSRRELVDRGFVPEDDYAVIEIAGDDPERVHQVLRELEQWIVLWAGKHGVAPIFKWRVMT